MIASPVRLVPTKGGEVPIVFPDVPQAVAEGLDEQDALYRAKFVLEMCLGQMLAHGDLPPRRSDICGAPTVTRDKFTRVREEAA